MTDRKKLIRISVRRLVEFLLRTGSIEAGGIGLSQEAAMLEGARIHRRLQKQAGESYHAEVPLRVDIPIPADVVPAVLPEAPFSQTAEGAALGFHRGSRTVPAGSTALGVALLPPEAVHSDPGEAEAPGVPKTGKGEPAEALQRQDKREEALLHPEVQEKEDKQEETLLHPEVQEKEDEQEKVILRLEGRADGIIFDSGIRMIDEIKTVPGPLGSLEAPKEVHLAQARCYAYIHAREEGLLQVRIRMTYCSQETEEVRFFCEELGYEELEDWFGGLIRAWLPWVGLQLYFENRRMETIRQAVFPFPYREGQHALAAGVYRTIVHGKKLFLQAPTGTGKTMAVLFPALKAIGEGKAERIFYLTAKAVTGRAALDALQILSERGLRIRSLVLASKERICPEGMDCRPARCPRAKGHFDRVNAALWDLFREAAGGASMTSALVEKCAGRHCVCPYALSMDAADFADVVICDYNYAFHPAARLSRFFGEGAEKGTILLIDEAHNLLDRSRSMYSADLSAAEVRRFRRSIRGTYPRLWKTMKGLAGVLRRLEKEAGDPAGGRPAEAGRQGRAKEGGIPLVLLPERRQDLLREIGETMRVISWILEQENRTGALYVQEKRSTPHAGENRTSALYVQEKRSTPHAGESGTSALYLQEDSIMPRAGETGTGALFAEDTGESSDGLPDLLDFYFSITRFHNILEELDSRYLVYTAPPGFVLHLFCADPSARLQACMKRSAAAVFFSATFLPIQYYKGLLGGTGEDYEMYARSSFSPAQQKVVLVRDVTSRYRARNEENYRRIARSIGGIVACRPGNYMVFFPSYAFLENVRDAFCGIFAETHVYTGQETAPLQEDMTGPVEDMAGPLPRMDLLIQRPKMDDAERAAFLEAFHETCAGRYLVGFCVLGGMFGEGIDLQGDRLIGSLVVGTGIPPVEPQREMLKEYFYAQGVNGYDYAYRFPGMNKVLQAAGRVIRTSQDRGVILLLDERFADSGNRAMFPVEWGDPVPAASTEAAEIVRLFWQENGREGRRS